MVARVRRLRRPATRGVSPIIGGILLVGLTIVAGTVLWGFRVQFPSTPVQIWYETESPVPSEAYADGSDCHNVGSGANATQVCDGLTAIEIVVTSFQPSYLALSSLQLYFSCDGSTYLSGTLAAMEWNPGSTGTIGGGPGSGVPSLGTCGSYVPPRAAFNRFMFFQAIDPGATGLQAGDRFVIFAEGFTPPSCRFAPSTLDVCWIDAGQNSAVQSNSKLFPSTCPVPSYAANANPATNGSYGLNGCDDDYHGVPDPACYLVAGACGVTVAYLGPPDALALRVSMVGLLSPGAT
ncbi:MAG TPA: archaellin/type IV pilin N-terminal domain-containing protein [Thermoplasmata archaeon]|nr:archaellin/type IV pilin N-terminal domain-containing protein [Thermoplasmata archaeon]